MKPVYLGTNWKMHKDLNEAMEYTGKLLQFHVPEHIQLFLIPPFTHLQSMSERLKGTGIWLGAQNAHWEDEGDYTGEVSPRMLKSFNIDLIELGHSERRKYWGETDYTVNKKALAGIANGMKVLICVGEGAEDKNCGVSHEYVKRQVKIALKDIPPEKASQIMLAYEPLWSIGASGIPAQPDYAGSIHGTIKETLAELFGKKDTGIPVLYGGSVNLDNCIGFLSAGNVDGLFIGRAAWTAENLLKIVKRVAEEFIPVHQ